MWKAPVIFAYECYPHGAQPGPNLSGRGSLGSVVGGTLSSRPMFGAPGWAVDNCIFDAGSLPITSMLANSSGDYTLLFWGAFSFFDSWGGPFTISNNGGGNNTLFVSPNGGASSIDIWHSSNTVASGVTKEEYTVDGEAPHLFITSRSGTRQRCWFDGALRSDQTFATAIDTSNAAYQVVFGGSRDGHNSTGTFGFIAFLAADIMTDALARSLYDPRTRWDLYWMPSTTTYAFLSSTPATPVGAKIIFRHA